MFIRRSKLGVWPRHDAGIGIGIGIGLCQRGWLSGSHRILPSGGVASGRGLTCSPNLGQRELESSGVKAHEPGRIQTLGPEFAIEGLDEAVVGRLAGAGKVEHDPFLIRPWIQIPTDKLRALAACRVGVPSEGVRL